MSCYECGAPEGNEAKLCPACNKKRFESHSDFVEQIAPRVKTLPPATLNHQQKILAAVAIALLSGVAVWALAVLPTAKSVGLGQ